MIERFWALLREFWAYIGSTFDPIRDTIDILFVTFAIYWLLLLIRGTRAVQILVGLTVLVGVNLLSEAFQLVTLRLILENFLSSAVLIFIVIFQQDIRRALAQVGKGFFRSTTTDVELQGVEDIVKATQELAARRIGAILVIERETVLDDQTEAGTRIDAELTKDLLAAIFQPQSPLHDGGVLIQQGRIAAAGCILPLSSRNDLPAGVGTRHRAAVGITEETDALVVVVSEETGAVSVVMGGEMLTDISGPQLRNVLRAVLSGEMRELPKVIAGAEEPEAADDARSPNERARARWGRG